jgi:hypothetical protein
MTDQPQIISLFQGKIIYFKKDAPRPEEFKDAQYAELIEWKDDQVYARFIRNPGTNAINVHLWIPLDHFDL